MVKKKKKKKKKSPALQEIQETGFPSQGREDLLEEEMTTYYSILAWKMPWTEESGRLQSIGWQRLGSSWAHTHTQNRSQGVVTMLPFPSDLLCLTPLVSWLSLCTTDCWGFSVSMSSLLICHLPSAWPTAPLWPLESGFDLLSYLLRAFFILTFWPLMLSDGLAIANDSDTTSESWLGSPLW